MPVAPTEQEYCTSIVSGLDFKVDIAAIPFDPPWLRKIFCRGTKSVHCANETSGLSEVRSEPPDLTESENVEDQSPTDIHPYSLFCGAYTFAVPLEVDGVSRDRLIRMITNDSNAPFEVEGFMEGSISGKPDVSRNSSMSALKSELQGINCDSSPDDCWNLSLVQLDCQSSDHPSPSTDDQDLVETKATPWTYIGTVKLWKTIGSMKVNWETPVVARMYIGTTGRGATFSDKPEEDEEC